MASSSAPKYDVFLSSCGNDAKDFSYLLYKGLQSNGILTLTLKDDQEVKKEDTDTTSSLELAIKDSRFFIVILSDIYICSPEHLEQLSQLCGTGERLLPIFYHVTPSFIYNQREFGKEPERWGNARRQVARSSGWSTSHFREDTKIIQEIVDFFLRKRELSISVEENKKIIEQPAVDDDDITHISDISVKEETSVAVIERINDHEGQKSAKDASVERNFLFCTLGLEILSAGFDQASSPSKPHYALIGMLFAIAAVFTCIWELIHKGSIVLKSWEKLQCIWYPYPSNTFFNSLPDTYGLASSICQCVFSAVQYTYFFHHASSPIKLTVLPSIFLMCLAGSRVYQIRKNVTDMAPLKQLNPSSSRKD